MFVYFISIIVSPRVWILHSTLRGVDDGMRLTAGWKISSRVSPVRFRFYEILGACVAGITFAVNITNAAAAHIVVSHFFTWIQSSFGYSKSLSAMAEKILNVSYKVKKLSAYMQYSKQLRSKLRQQIPMDFVKANTIGLEGWAAVRIVQGYSPRSSPSAINKLNTLKFKLDFQTELKTEVILVW